jgi:hypothetical protein
LAQAPNPSLYSTIAREKKLKRLRRFVLPFIQRNDGANSQGPRLFHQLPSRDGTRQNSAEIHRPN